MNNNASKNVTLSIIGVALLIVAVVGVSFAFFSYLSTGGTNSVSTGTIEFHSSADSVTLTNQFPTTEAGALKVTVNASGLTTYENGIDFKVRAIDVVPGSATITPTVTVTAAEGLDSKVTELNVYSGTTLTAATDLCTGTIAKNVQLGTKTEGVTTDETLVTISAFYDKAKYHITDYEGDKQDLVDAGLLDTVSGKTFVTTAEWNALAATPFSFKIQVTATEGQ